MCRFRKIANTDHFPAIVSILHSLNYIGFRTRIKFCHVFRKTVVNAYIVYEISLWPFKQSPVFTLGNSLFGAVRRTKNAEFVKHKYSRHSIDLMRAEVFVISW